MELRTRRFRNIVRGITQKIKDRALEAGFDKVRIVRAEPLEAERAHFEKWLREGRSADMHWIEREPEKRTDPQILMPGARSIVAVALNYFTPHEHPANESLGKISRYAWGDDYHDILKTKLRELLAWITAEIPECEGKACVDTAPIMDKAWAVRAGIGWLGKHSNVITPEFGSWVFLGELLLNIELEYDDGPMDEHCGTCTACIDACPTNAIVAPYVVDSAKCLSYVTIESRTDEIPADIAGNMEGWLYGCDICQDVCPWNRFEKPTREERFEPRKGETAVELDEVLEFTPDSYAARFRKSAIKRAKLPGLKRNARTLRRASEDSP